MKKTLAVLLVLVMMTALSLSSCATTQKSSPSTEPSSPEQSSPEPAQAPSSAGESSPGNAATASPAETGGDTYAQMNANMLEFGGDVDAFFDAYENTDRALDALQPILFSALFAAFDATDMFYVGDEPVDAEFEWTAVYHLINDYETDREGITQDGGNLTVPSDVMLQFFADMFGVKAVTFIPDSLHGLITYDTNDETYTLQSAGIGGLFFVLDNISLSKASSADDPTQCATIRFDVQGYEGETLKKICIEIVRAPDSTFNYSVMDAFTYDFEPDAPSAAVPNPMQPSSAKEIVDTLGYSFHLPDSASDISYYIVDGEPKLAQADFIYDGSAYTFRIQGGAAFTDISGMFCDWKAMETVQVSYCTGEVRYNAGEQGVCLWYDVVPGLMYSVSMDAGAEKETLVAMAEMLFVPAQGDA